MKRNWLSTAACLLLMMGIFLTIVDFCCFDSNFYAKIYKQENTAASIGVTDETLVDMTNILLDYLKDKRDNIDGTAVVKGVEREIYDQREKLHMVDVKALYKNALLIRGACLIGAAVLFAVVWFQNKKESFTLYRKGYVRALCVFAGIFAALGLYAFIDFDRFWTDFHLLLFDNDLWLLDPATEIMINMVPSAFFSALVYRIIILVFVSLLFLYLLFRFLERKTA
ncbi:MAG: TIGR01906 family membrane protein [Erysipelotrichaceae bacterium]|nr:TIGR01906 family membrane protein [Erysipelotrichaceae bacterium]